jgi:hypothetical protein
VAWADCQTFVLEIVAWEFVKIKNSGKIVLDFNRRNSLIMDRLTTISATLFLAADVFAIVSLAMPDWIVTDTGETRFGLMWSCVTLGIRVIEVFLGV